MSLSWRDLVGVSVAAVVLMLVTQLHDLPPLLLLLAAVPLAMILPGYALREALVPDFDGRLLPRWALAIGLSIVVTILLGLVLHFTVWGVRGDTAAIGLAGLTCGLSSIAQLRRHRRRQPAAPVVVERLTVGQGALLGLALVIGLAALVIARVGAQTSPQPTFTQLWLLPIARADGGAAVRLGVYNAEQRSVEYQLQLVADGATVYTANVTLDSNQPWEAIVTVPTTGVQRYEATLARTDQGGAVYRSVRLLRSGQRSGAAEERAP